MNEKLTITHDGIVSGLVAKADNTIKFSISCQEMDREKAGRLIALNNQHIKFLVTNENITDQMSSLVVETAITADKKKKSKSQKLREVLYRLWEQTQTDLDSEEFYNKKMDWFIEFIKDKLE